MKRERKRRGLHATAIQLTSTQIAKAGRLAMKQICKDRYEAFGTAGNASKIKVLSLEAMTTRYAKGELDPKVN